MKNLILSVSLLLILQPVSAQKVLPVINTKSRTVMIQDGNHVKINSWGLDPKLKPDVYYTNIPEKNSKVTFITDQDSISFDTQFGQVYDFVIVLNGKDSCYTRISANYNGVIDPRRLGASKKTGPDVIPFTMRGSRIYFSGKVNGRSGITIQFDLGAGGSCVNKNSMDKTGVRFNGKTMLSNTQGTNEALTSSNNKLEIAGLEWSHVPLVQVGNMDNDEDLIIGNSLFGNKVIEIDYDKKLMILHDQLPVISADYSSQDVIYEQHRPKVQASVIVVGERYTDWFLFDTGRDGTMFIGEGFVSKFNLWDQFYTVLNMGNKKIVRLPKVTLGALTFRDIITNAANPAKPSGRPSLLGNELLNHFNIILDNKNGVIYLKPNSLQGRPYSNWEDLRFRGTVLIFAVLIVMTVFVTLTAKLFRRKKNAQDINSILGI